MQKFINKLPDNTIEEKIKIAFCHFMAGTKMYSKEGWEITTQDGFKYVALHEFKSKSTENSLNKYIEKYNKENVTPTKYRELNTELDEYHTKDFEQRRLDNFKKKHPVKYIITKLQNTMKGGK